MEYVFKIPIKPQVKQRPRFNGHAYTPDKTRAFEKVLKIYFKKSKKFECALQVEIIFQFEKPKKPARNYPSKGDLDNYVKAVLDSMNGLVFNDDSQVIKLIAEKKWGESDLITVKVTQNSSVQHDI